LEQVLRREGFRVAVMRATVPTDRREAWIADRLREGVDVVLCQQRP
jgi:arylamine N-acetyltransferase